MQEIIKVIGGGAFISGIFAFIGNWMGWIRFSKSDRANVNKVDSETKMNLAEEANKKVDQEVKISKVSLEWTVQLAGQLEKANLLNEKRQLDIERLHNAMQEMREEFDVKMKEMESMLATNQKELNTERQKNTELLSQLKEFIHGGKKQNNGTTQSDTA